MKSDLNLLNAIRAFPIFPLDVPLCEARSLSPLHHGAEGDKHHLRKKKVAKLESIEPEDDDNDVELIFKEFSNG